MSKRVIAGEIVISLSPTTARKLLRRLGWERRGSGWVDRDEHQHLDLEDALAAALDARVRLAVPDEH